jgi:hypothetical protein
LAALKAAFPTARHLVFGWGARDYYMAQNPSITDLLRAAAPGPAVMLVIPLQASPEALGVAGLPVTASGVVFAGQVLDQLAPVLEPVTNAQSER